MHAPSVVRLIGQRVMSLAHPPKLNRKSASARIYKVAQAVVLVQDMVLAGDRMSFDALLPLAPHSVLCRSPGCARESGHVDPGPGLEANECFNRLVCLAKVSLFTGKSAIRLPRVRKTKTCK